MLSNESCCYYYFSKLSTNCLLIHLNMAVASALKVCDLNNTLSFKQQIICSSMCLQGGRTYLDVLISTGLRILCVKKIWRNMPRYDFFHWKASGIPRILKEVSGKTYKSILFRVLHCTHWIRSLPSIWPPILDITLTKIIWGPNGPANSMSWCVYSTVESVTQYLNLLWWPQPLKKFPQEHTTWMKPHVVVHLEPFMSQFMIPKGL